MLNHMIYTFTDQETNLTYNRTCVCDLHYHLVWVTKYRHKVLTPIMQNEIKQELLQIADKFNFKIEAMEVLENHVHILVYIPPKYSVANAVRWFKGITGRKIFQEYPELKNKLWHGHLWSRSYYAGSIGQTTEAIVTNYIKTQKERPYK